MPRHTNPTDQHLDANGNPYSGGQLFFYDTGTTTPVDTYSYLAESDANANPVILDSAGREPDIFITGVYKVVLKDASGNTIWTRDPVEASDTSNLAYVAYDATVTYALYEKVQATNSKYYESLSATNLNNEPSISPTKWTEIRSLEVWNTNVTYTLGDVVVDSVGKLWRSLVGSNAGNTPGSDDTKWVSAITDLWVSKTASFPISAGSKYNITATSGAVDAALPLTIVEGDPIKVHNSSTSTDTVRITNTHTIRGNGGTLTTGNHLILKPGDTAELAAISSSILEAI